MTERAQNADFRRKPQIFADSPLLLEIQAFGERRKPKIFAENRRKPQIGLRQLRSVTFSSALVSVGRRSGLELSGFQGVPIGPQLAQRIVHCCKAMGKKGKNTDSSKGFLKKSKACPRNTWAKKDQGSP